VRDAFDGELVETIGGEDTVNSAPSKVKLMLRSREKLARGRSGAERQPARELTEATGWTQADPLGIGSSWRMACAFVLNRPYPSAPFSTLYLFNRGQDAVVLVADADPAEIPDFQVEVRDESGKVLFGINAQPWSQASFRVSPSGALVRKATPHANGATFWTGSPRPEYRKCVCSFSTQTFTRNRTHQLWCA
jgi:hypothetical protein